MAVSGTRSVGRVQRVEIRNCGARALTAGYREPSCSTSMLSSLPQPIKATRGGAGQRSGSAIQRRAVNSSARPSLWKTRPAAPALSDPRVGRGRDSTNLPKGQDGATVRRSPPSSGPSPDEPIQATVEALVLEGWGIAAGIERVEFAARTDWDRDR